MQKIFDYFSSDFSVLELAFLFLFLLVVVLFGYIVDFIYDIKVDKRLKNLDKEISLLKGAKNEDNIWSWYKWY